MAAPSRSAIRSAPRARASSRRSCTPSRTSSRRPDSPPGVPGLGRLLGPTGGYLLAYPLAAFAVGRIAGDAARWGPLVLGVLAGLALIHLGGLAQLLLITGSLRSAVQLGTLPFLLGDLGK